MKKILLAFILICTTIVSASCTIAPDPPSNGIWYCEELKLVIEFGENQTFVCSYDEKLSKMDLQLRIWIDGGFDVVCLYEDERIVEIYCGWRKFTNNDIFIISLYSKANPKDHYRTQIELDDEEYTFIKIDNYAEISK